MGGKGRSTETLVDGRGCVQLPRLPGTHPHVILESRNIWCQTVERNRHDILAAMKEHEAEPSHMRVDASSPGGMR